MPISEDGFAASISPDDRFIGDEIVRIAERQRYGTPIPGSVRVPLTDAATAADLDRLADRARVAREVGDVANAPTFHLIYVEARQAATASGRLAPTSRHYDRGPR